MLVEPPGGSAGRRRGPFAGDVDDGEHSLTFWGWNRGKRSVVVDVDTPRRARPTSPASSPAPTSSSSAGPCPSTWRALRAADPALVTVSITPFGDDGPKADWPATDLTVNAAGCQLAISGDDDRAPVRTAVPQSFLHAAADAAAGALLAVTERAASGLGQHVEISAQRSMMQATQSYVLAVPLGGTPAQRMSGGVRTGGLDIQLVWPCADGYASVTFLFGASIGPFTRRLMEWIHEEGFCDEATRDKDWLDYANQLYDGREPISEYDRVKAIVGEFCATKTKAELLEAACDRMLLIAPVTTPEDVLRQRPVRRPRVLRPRRRRAPGGHAGDRARPVGPLDGGTAPAPRSGPAPRRAHGRGARRRPRPRRRARRRPGRPGPAGCRWTASRCSTSRGRWPARPRPG